MNKKLIFCVLALFFVCSCALVKRDNCLVDTPSFLLEHTKSQLEVDDYFKNSKCGEGETPTAYLNKSSCEIKSDITFELMRKLFANAGKKIQNN